MEQNAQDKDLQKIQLRGERAVLHVKLLAVFYIASLYGPFVFIFAWIVCDDRFFLYGIVFTISVIIASIALYQFTVREIKKADDCVLIRMFTYHSDRLKKLIVTRSGIMRMDEVEETLLMLLSREVPKNNTAGNHLPAEISSAREMPSTVLGHSLMRKYLLTEESACIGNSMLDTRLLDIDVLRTFKGELLRFKIRLSSELWPRKDILAQYFAIPQCRDETVSLRRTVFTSFLMKAAVSFLIATVLILYWHLKI